MESYDERRRRDEERRQARHEDRGRDRDSWWRGERSEHDDDRPRRAERGWLDYDRDYGGPRDGREQEQRYAQQGNERSRFSPDWSREGAQPRYSDEPYYSRNRDRDSDEYPRSSRSSGGWRPADRDEWEQRSRESIPREQRELAERSERGDYYDPDWPYDRGERGRQAERSRGQQRPGGRQDEGSHYRGWYSRSGGPFAYPGGQGYVFSESLTLHGPYAGRGPKGYKRSDQQIVEEACQRLERDGEVDATDIEVTAEDGIIRLRGTVPDRQTKRRAEECVESIYGAKDVMNELRVSREGHDQWQGGQGSQSQGTQAGRGTQASQGSQASQGMQGSQSSQSAQGTQTPGMRPGAGSSSTDQAGDEKRTPRH
jgi:hypothetical protein